LVSTCTLFDSKSFRPGLGENHQPAASQW
jgi:hypothetical protein